MSDSEDDFMSDKFLVDAAVPKQQTYTQRREAERLKSLRKGQAKNMPSLAQREKEQRAAGLNRSLFDGYEPTVSPNEGGVEGKRGEPSRNAGSSTDSMGSRDGNTTNGLTEGGNKAMAMMMKMGWKVGQGLGRRSPSPPQSVGSSSKRPRLDDGQSDEEEATPSSRGGIGSSRPKIPPLSDSTPPSRTKGRAEPIRVSLWAGRKGLSARSPSPPPLPTSSNRNPDALDPTKLAKLGERTDDFRSFQRQQFAGREVQKNEWKAREMLVKLDEEKGVMFHPLHIIPTDPLKVLPHPLARLIYPTHHIDPDPSSPSPSPEPIYIPGENRREQAISIDAVARTKLVSEAERTRDRMRRDMLTSLPAEDDDAVRIRKRELGLDGEAIGTGPSQGSEIDVKDYGTVDWESMVSGSKRVLTMDPETHLRFILSQLRNEHMFCLWCATKYSSFEEMDGPGGCPGEEEDDH